MTKREVFAENLTYLLAAAKLGKKEAAEELGVSYPWLRRASTGGVGRLDSRNQKTLDKLTEYFCLSCSLDLWQQGLREELGRSEKYQEFRRKFLVRACPGSQTPPTREKTPFAFGLFACTQRKKRSRRWLRVE